MANINILPDHKVVVNGKKTEVHCFQGSRLVIEKLNRNNLGDCPFCDAKDLEPTKAPEERVHTKVIEL